MKSLIKTTLALCCALIAIFVAIDPIFWRHWFVLVTFGKFPGLKTYGPSCDTTPIMSLEKSTRFSTHKHCFNETGGIYWYDAAHNETLSQALLLTAVEKHCPILVYRPFKDDKCFDRLQYLGDKYPDLEVRVKTNVDELMDAFRLFPEGAHETAIAKLSSKRDSLKSLLNEYKEGYSMKFTAFDPSLNSSAYEALYGMKLDWLKNGKAGSTFLSNYNRTILTTPFHSAFSESFGYQCEGTKHWHLLTPEDAFPTVRYHNIFTHMKDCNERKDILPLIFTTHTTKDTMFYFPPFWAHSVETERGLSVLLNYRAMDIKRIFHDNFKIGLLCLTSFFYYGTFFRAWDPDEISYFYRTGIVPALTGAKARTGWHKNNANLPSLNDFNGQSLHNKMD